MKEICIWCARRFEADSGPGYVATDPECPRCAEKRRLQDRPPYMAEPVRPWYRVMGRAALLGLVVVVYLLVLWPIFVNAWTYWSTITQEKSVRKIDEVEIPTSCFNKAAPEEPIFVVRAKDPEAPDTVRTWANNAQTRGTHEPEKIAEAFALADRMEAYRREKFPEKAATV
jgi:DNA-directed RNA polymerase subunit RPC12/RpoP